MRNGIWTMPDVAAGHSCDIGRCRRPAPGIRKPSAGLRHWRGERGAFASGARSPTRMDLVAGSCRGLLNASTAGVRAPVLRQPFKTTRPPRHCHPCTAGSAVCACSRARAPYMAAHAGTPPPQAMRVRGGPASPRRRLPQPVRRPERTPDLCAAAPARVLPDHPCTPGVSRVGSGHDRHRHRTPSP